MRALRLSAAMTVAAAAALTAQVHAGPVVGFTTNNVIPHYRQINQSDYTSAYQALVGDGYTMQAVNELSPDALAGLDTLLLGIVDFDEVLSGPQLDIIVDYVRGGGSLFFWSENNLFFGDNNVAFGERFGITFPEFDGRETVAFDTPIPDHPIIQGPAGTVSFIDGTNNSLRFFGSIQGTGPYGTSVLNLPSGYSAVTVIEPGRLAPGSGPVIVVPESNIWENEQFFAADNDTLWRNIFAYATNPVPAPPAAAVLALAVFAGRRRRRAKTAPVFASAGLAAVMLLAAPAGADVVWDNGPLVTHPGGGFNGADLSAVPTMFGYLTLGEGHQLIEGERIADDFTLTETTLLDNVMFYAYQSGSGLHPTIRGVNVRIWDGPPTDKNSQIVFGDDTTNRMIWSNWTGMYRASDTDRFNNERPVMEQLVNLGVELNAGTYWMDWQTDGIEKHSGPWAPPVSLPDAIYVGNGFHFDPEDGWDDSFDGRTGVGLDFPFLIQDTPVPAPPVVAVALLAGLTVTRRRRG